MTISIEMRQAQDRVRTLTAELAALQKEQLTSERVKREIFKLSERSVQIPAWSAKPPVTPKHGPGVPTLFASDWHWGEKIDPNQIGGINRYDLSIAHKRARALINQTLDLLFTRMVNPNYPGIVFALGGDMISGDIHDELRITNEMASIPTLLDLVAVLTWGIGELADRFGAVFIPCVTGNHGRTTIKIQAKDRHHTSYDWLLYMMLAKAFEADKRVTFQIADSSDALYKVFNTVYCLTHGDQFRGGDGVIGALGPIIRGDHRKRSRNGQIGASYDVLLLGHWHQLIQMQRLIVNGSLKGYDEYAYQNNFGFEVPRQALWITHPDHGITFQMPVLVEPHTTGLKPAWAAIPQLVPA